MEDDGVELPDLDSCEIRTGEEHSAREAGAEKAERS
jgi:hypothetical protein